MSLSPPNRAIALSELLITQAHNMELAANAYNWVEVVEIGIQMHTSLLGITNQLDLISKPSSDLDRGRSVPSTSVERLMQLMIPLPTCPVCETAFVDHDLLVWHNKQLMHGACADAMRAAEAAEGKKPATAHIK